MSIKTSFSIKDLENLSGVKAHTIRIWEKRYNLLRPERSNTNIRTYNQENLMKLLNVSLMIQYGYKISKIAQISDLEMNQKIKELAIEKDNSLLAINSFKLAMMNFDQTLFDATFNQLLTQSSFREIFLNVFLKLLEEIGVLWLTKTISPAHEHFISNLIKQKLLINIERVQQSNISANKIFVMYLPMNEIHELGLMYIHFELLLKGYKSIYLGQSVPIESLKDLQAQYSDITFISYFTVKPNIDKVKDYLTSFHSQLLSKSNDRLLIIGRNTDSIGKNDLPPQVEKFENILNLIEQQ